MLLMMTSLLIEFSLSIRSAVCGLQSAVCNLQSAVLYTQVKRWKQTLRYRIVWNEKISLTIKNSFWEEAIFSLG